MQNASNLQEADYEGIANEAQSERLRQRRFRGTQLCQIFSTKHRSLFVKVCKAGLDTATMVIHQNNGRHDMHIDAWMQGSFTTFEYLGV